MDPTEDIVAILRTQLVVGQLPLYDRWFKTEAYYNAKWMLHRECQRLSAVIEHCQITNAEKIACIYILEIAEEKLRRM